MEAEKRESGREADGSFPEGPTARLWAITTEAAPTLASFCLVPRHSLRFARGQCVKGVMRLNTSLAGGLLRITQMG
jgi:hypothetical protein